MLTIPRLYLIPPKYRTAQIETSMQFEAAGVRGFIPSGYETDGASIPRLLWAILPPFGVWAPAAVVHDFLYYLGGRTGVSRADADKAFLALLKELGCPNVGWIMWLGVRAGGWVSYGNASDPQYNEEIEKLIEVDKATAVRIR